MPSFLIDECVPRDVYEAIAQAGHAIVLVSSTSLGAIDEEVVSYAREHGHVVFTEDRRFGFIAMNAGPPGGVVVLLMGNAAPAAKAARVSAVLPAIANTLANAITVISPTHVRRRII